MRWSIDAADAYSVAKVRHAAIAQLQQLTGGAVDLFAVETVLGELLGAEMERGHFAVAVIVERGVGGPEVHVYLQGSLAATSTRGELRRAILKGTQVPMSIETTGESTHVVIAVPQQELARPAR